MRKCLKLFANEVAMSPLENKNPPSNATFRYPKHFNKAPLNNPRVIPKAEFKFKINDASKAVKFNC
jgi:hypothetical protein